MCVCVYVCLSFVYLAVAKFLVFLMMNSSRVTPRGQRRVGKGLVERMGFNLVQMFRYVYCRLSVEGSAYLFVNLRIM